MRPPQPMSVAAAQRAGAAARVGSGGRRFHRMFGLTLASTVVLPGVPTVRAAGGTVVTVDMAHGTEVERRFSGATIHRGRLSQGDGETIDVVLGEQSDILLRYGRHAVFLIEPGGGAVFCAPAEPHALEWRRVLLDTVLGTTALVRGHEALHAGAVECPEGVVAIASASGGGKSTLCAELVRRGARLFTDDMVFLTQAGGGVLAHPGPPLMNLPVAWPGDATELGESLGIMGTEAWIAVRRASTSPAPLLAVILLDRRAGAETSVEPDSSPSDLLAFTLDSGPDAGRLAARFALLARIARSTPVLRLAADVATPPGVLAEVVEATARRVAGA